MKTQKEKPSTSSTRTFPDSGIRGFKLEYISEPYSMPVDMKKMMDYFNPCTLMELKNKDIKVTCLSANCPERTGGDCDWEMPPEEIQSMNEYMKELQNKPSFRIRKFIYNITNPIECFLWEIGAWLVNKLIFTPKILLKNEEETKSFNDFMKKANNYAKNNRTGRKP